MSSFVFAASISAIIVVLCSEFAFMMFARKLNLHECLTREIRRAYYDRHLPIYFSTLILVMFLAFISYSVEVDLSVWYILTPALAFLGMSLFTRLTAFMNKLNWAIEMSRNSFFLGRIMNVEGFYGDLAIEIECQDVCRRFIAEESQPPVESIGLSNIEVGWRVIVFYESRYDNGALRKNFPPILFIARV